MSDSSCRQKLLFGAEKLAIQLSQKESNQLLTFLELIARWNRKHNLTALRSLDEMVVKHLLDSLSVQPYLPAGQILDVGSGAGLPGIPLAIINPQQSFTLVDASYKRVAFMQTVKRELRLENVTAIHSRVEDLPASTFEVITSRAFSSLAEMLEKTCQLLAPTGQWLAMKGVYPEQEVTSLPDSCRLVASYVLEVPYLNANRHLLCIEKTAIVES